MTEQAESGATVTEGGANGQTDQSKDSKTQTPDPGTKRALEDTIKYKKQVQELQQQLKSFQEEKLKGEQNFKSLWETTKQELESVRSERDGFFNSYFEEQKRTAVKTDLIKLGLRPEAEADVDLIDLSDVAIEKTDQGRVLVHGANQKAEQIKKSRPHWFKNQKDVTINSGGTNTINTGDQKLTPMYMVELEKKDPKKYRELFPKYLEQRNKK